MRGAWARLKDRARSSHKVARVRGALSRVTEDWGRPLALRASVRHLHGPRRVPYGDDELIALCVVRNGAAHVTSFLRHHQRLGVKHIVLLDNGSTDGTVDLARAFAGVTILRSRRPYRTYETVLKRYLVRRFARGRWSLMVDIDERFDYPGSDRMGVAALLTYLNRNAYTAVLAQMLDLFSEAPLRCPPTALPDSLAERYCHYDTSAVERHPYRFGTPANPAIRMHAGGIRKTIFGTENGLTKACLIRLVPPLVPFVGFHQVANGTIADFTAVLLHYPFAGAFVEKVREAVQTDRYRVSAGEEYVKYWARLQDEPDLRLWRPTARRYVGLEPLLEEGFLVTSPAYRRWMEAPR
jgi:glycosyltransferase involved in cell wall biosynthesis